jgi:hypothetical protein
MCDTDDTFHTSGSPRYKERRLLHERAFGLIRNTIAKAVFIQMTGLA